MRKSDKPLIGIVTVLYNSSSVLDDFFRTLNDQSFKNFILYVIDNKSADDSLAKARALSEAVSFRTKIIANPDNYGVAKGNNQGIENALKDGCDFVLLSNNDVVLEDTTIETLLREHLALHADMSVPKIYLYQSNRLYFGGGKFYKFRASSVHFGYNKPDGKKYGSTRQINYAPTCFMLIDKSVFDAVGMMDENYFVYYDDTDFIYRSQRIGLKLVYIPLASIQHKESVCTGRRSDFFYKYLFRNRAYFLLKNFKMYPYYLGLDFILLYTVRLLKMRKSIAQWKLIRGAMFDGFKMYADVKAQKVLIDGDKR